MYMLMLHVLAACSCCMSVLHVLAACSCCMFMLHVHAASHCCMSLLHVQGRCQCCMYKLCPAVSCRHSKFAHHCIIYNITPTVAEILEFGRETGFPTQTLQRWYMYKSTQQMETNLINVSKSCYLVLILDSHYKRLLLSLLSYPDVNAIWKLSALSCDKKFVGISKIPVNTASAQIQEFKYGLSSNPGILDYQDFIFVGEYQLCVL